jgi:hypothetical protein
MSAALESLRLLAKDLTRDFPRSPRETLGGYILAARILDKCRAVVAGTNGEYNFNCPLDRLFFDFTGIDADAFREFIATGASDEQVAQWITGHAKERPRGEIVQWNNEWRYKRISELPEYAQVFLEDYLPQVIPAGRVIYYWFDVYDIEEQRL